MLPGKVLDIFDEGFALFRDKQKNSLDDHAVYTDTRNSFRVLEHMLRFCVAAQDGLDAAADLRADSAVAELVAKYSALAEVAEELAEMEALEDYEGLRILNRIHHMLYYNVIETDSDAAMLLALREPANQLRGAVAKIVAKMLKKYNDERPDRHTE